MKQSRYTLAARDATGNVILYNTKSGKYLPLEAPLAKAFLHPREDQTSTLTHDDIYWTTKLVRGGFVIDDDVNELEEIRQNHLVARSSGDFLVVTITPTMDCNLGCYYCFERVKYKGLMSEQIQNGTINLLERKLKSGVKYLHITWFGGEPLLGLPVIEKLSERILKLCEAHGTEYVGAIVTNGVLLDDKAIETLLRCKVGFVQITFDGPEPVHDTRRIYLDGSPSFGQVLDAVKRASNKFELTIRINTDRVVAARFDELVERLGAEKVSKNAKISVAPLRDTSEDVIHDSCYPNDTRALNPIGVGRAGRGGNTPLYQLKDFANDDLKLDEIITRNGFRSHLQLKTPIGYSCTADIDNGFVIEANGCVQKCWDTVGMTNEAVGMLREDGEIDFTDNNRKWHDWDAFHDDVCSRCVFLPSCLGNCPKEHLTFDPDHCPPFRYNWEAVLARVALRQREGSVSNSPYSRTRVNLLNGRLIPLTTKDVLARGSMVIYESIKTLKLKRRESNWGMESKDTPSDSTFILRSENRLEVLLNSTGQAVWNMLDGTRSVEEIVGELVRMFSVVPSEQTDVSSTVVDFLIDLANGGLLSQDSMNQLEPVKTAEAAPSCIG